MPDSMAAGPKSIVALAEELAQRYHAGQVDRLGEPYIEHPRAVAGLLAGGPEDLQAAPWLHDVLEHTEATATELVGAGVPQGGTTRRSCSCSGRISPNGKEGSS